MRKLDWTAKVDDCILYYMSSHVIVNSLISAFMECPGVSRLLVSEQASDL